jgi:predicted RNA polymerase sigma factor
MLLTHARREARTDETAGLVLLGDQDRSRWDAALVAEGTALLDAAWARRSVGVYQLQAAIASVHAAARTSGETDWPQIAALYLWLERLAPSGPVRLSRVVAVAKAYGAERGLALLDELEPLLSADPLVAWRRLAVRAHLLESTGSVAEAGSLYLDAAEQATNLAERQHLRDLGARLTR